ncbi:MAG: hypothetical protein ACE5F5_07685 [Acidimicrobiia bacterium]
MLRPAEQPGTLPRPGPVGRVGRFLLGLIAGTILVLVLLPRLEAPPGHRSPAPLFLVVAAIAVYILPDITRVTFRRRWGRKPIMVGAAVVVVLAIVDLVVYGRLYAPPLAWYLFLLVEVVFAIAAVSLLVAAVLAVPG